MIRLFRVFIPISTFTLFAVEILLTICSFLAASYLVLDVDPTDYLLYDGGVLGILAVTAIFLFGFYFSGLYSDVSFESKVILLHQLFLVTGLTFVAEGLISSVNSELRLPIRMMLAGSCLSMMLIFAWRLFFSRYASLILGHARVLLVGSDPVIAAVSRYIDLNPQKGFRIAGYVSDEAVPSDWPDGGKHFGETGSLPEIIRAVHPSRVVIGMRRTASNPEFARMLEDLRFAGENIQEAAETYEKVSGRVWVRGIDPAELIYTSRFGAPQRHLLMQRFFDSLLAAVVLLLSLPLLAVAWIILKYQSGDRVLEAQPRVGLNNRPFLQYRFRMDAQTSLLPGGWGLSFVRRFHLDGLPQLLNVMKGEMAFVGPRPERPEFVEVLSGVIPYYRQRHCTRPGMTGWAQMQTGDTLEDTFAKLEYDLYYIKNMSTSLNTLIIFQTLRSMF